MHAHFEDDDRRCGARSSILRPARQGDVRTVTSCQCDVRTCFESLRARRSIRSGIAATSPRLDGVGVLEHSHPWVGAPGDSG